MYSHSHNISFVKERKSEVAFTRNDYVHRTYPQPKNYVGCFGTIYKECYWFLRYFWHLIRYDWEDATVDDLELPLVNRYKPESLQSLCQNTKFSKKELKVMYRGFKQGCPTGIVTFDEFKEIYSQFFPEGDSTRYAKFVFDTFDRDSNGQITFEEFVFGLSILSRGSLLDKVEWIFRLYDIKQKGQITRDELNCVVASIYDMMGKNSFPPIDKWVISRHVADVFDKMDNNRDGVITKAEFIKACLEDELICKTLGLFDTIL